MLSSLTATAVVADAGTWYAQINTPVLVVAGCLLAFAVGRYALRLLKRVAR